MLQFKEIFSLERRILPHIGDAEGARKLESGTPERLRDAGPEATPHGAAAASAAAAAIVFAEDDPAGTDDATLIQFIHPKAREHRLRIVGQVRSLAARQFVSRTMHRWTDGLLSLQELDHFLIYAYDTTLPSSTKRVTVIEIINVSEQETSPPRRLYTHNGEDMGAREARLFFLGVLRA
jgi:hypothetical protein